MRLFSLLLFMTTAIQAQSWDMLVDNYFDQAVFPFNPTNAVQDGFHAYDSQLEDLSQQSIQKEIAANRLFEARFASFAANQLTPDRQADRDLALSNIRSTLLSLEVVRMWEKDPDQYASTASSAAFTIMSRSFAPPEARLRSLIAREKLMPKLFAEGEANLKNPPKIYTEVAIQQVPDIIAFFEKDVPLAFKDVKDPALLNEFQQSNAAVVKELQAWQTWLKADLLPRSKGDYRLGADTYRKKLLDDEMVDIPLAQLLEIGYANLRKDQQQFRDTAKIIDAKENTAANFARGRKRPSACR